MQGDGELRDKGRVVVDCETCGVVEGVSSGERGLGREERMRWAILIDVGSWSSRVLV